MGIYSLVLLLKVEEELDERKKVMKEANTNRVEGLINQPMAHAPGNAIEFQSVPQQDLEGQTVSANQDSGPMSYTL